MDGVVNVIQVGGNGAPDSDGGGESSEGSHRSMTGGGGGGRGRVLYRLLVRRVTVRGDKSLLRLIGCWRE